MLTIPIWLFALACIASAFAGGTLIYFAFSMVEGDKLHREREE